MDAVKIGQTLPDFGVTTMAIMDGMEKIQDAKMTGMTLLGFTGIGSVDFMAAGFTLPLNFLAFVTGISLFPVCK